MASSSRSAAAAALLAGAALAAPAAAFVSPSAPPAHPSLRASVPAATTGEAAKTACSLGAVAGVAAAAIFFAQRRPAAAKGSTAAKSAVVRCAFEEELGATLPFKFFDPLGMSKDGDVAAFRRRRESEIKNGRVAMLAAIGYIVPEYFRWPGYCSPSTDLKFADIPNGIAALYKLPAEGWAQIGTFIAFLELFPMRQEKDRVAGDFSGYSKLGLPFGAPAKADPVGNRRGLEAELNNGRLAMLAISGMVAQNGLTGTTGAEMWFPGSAFENELGVQAPVGFWDPLGLSADGDADAFKRRRAVELKHGRISMLAAIGYIVPEYFRWPGEISPSQGLKFTDIPNGIGAISKVPVEGWLQIGLFLGHYEGYFFRQDPKRAPGDFENYGFLGIGKNFIFNFEPPLITDPEERKKKLSAEIANGRLAMFAILAMIFQNGTVGSTGPEMWLPSSAFETELGVQAPVGFWDPLGLSADGDVDNFKRRRAVELKHGRISMLAAIGYIVPEYFRWPGEISPSQGLKFTDIPHGIAAISKVPVEGWLQIGLFLGHYEGYFFRQDPKRAPGDFENYGFLGIGKNFIFNFEPPLIADPEERKKKLNAELANGRLAMFAILALIFQNGTVGSTGPEMWLPASAGR